VNKSPSLVGIFPKNPANAAATITFQSARHAEGGLAFPGNAMQRLLPAERGMSIFQAWFDGSVASHRLNFISQ
jgi:hypothetical protein